MMRFHHVGNAEDVLEQIQSQNTSIELEQINTEEAGRIANALHVQNAATPGWLKVLELNFRELPKDDEILRALTTDRSNLSSVWKKLHTLRLNDVPFTPDGLSILLECIENSTVETVQIRNVHYDEDERENQHKRLGRFIHNVLACNGERSHLRRLELCDLSPGGQPMYWECGVVPELCKQLKTSTVPLCHLESLFLCRFWFPPRCYADGYSAADFVKTFLDTVPSLKAVELNELFTADDDCGEQIVQIVAPYLPQGRLKSFKLARMGISNAASFRALADALAAPSTKLEVLDLVTHMNGLLRTKQDNTVFFEGIKQNNSLQVLRLEDFTLGVNAGLAFLKAAKTHRTLREVEFIETSIGTHVLSEINEHVTRLQCLKSRMLVTLVWAQQKAGSNQHQLRHLSVDLIRRLAEYIEDPKPIDDDDDEEEEE